MLTADFTDPIVKDPLPSGTYSVRAESEFEGEQSGAELGRGEGETVVVVRFGRRGEAEPRLIGTTDEEKDTTVNGVGEEVERIDEKEELLDSAERKRLEWEEDTLAAELVLLLTVSVLKELLVLFRKGEEASREGLREEGEQEAAEEEQAGGVILRVGKEAEVDDDEGDEQEAEGEQTGNEEEEVGVEIARLFVTACEVMVETEEEETREECGKFEEETTKVEVGMERREEGE